MTTLDTALAVPPAGSGPRAYVRAAPAEALAPPRMHVGWLGWAREHLFSNPLSTVLTILIVAALVLIVPPLVDFLFIDATWSGTDREACLATPARPEAGACWAFIRERFAYTIYGSYPIAERWRVDMFFALLAFGTAWLLWLDAPRRDLGVGVLLRRAADRQLRAAARRPALGLPVVDTALWGGMLVTIVVAAVGIVASLPIGIMLALGRRSQMPAIRLLSTIYIEFVRGVPLITVLFMASVMLPLFLPETWSPDKLIRALVGVALFASAYMAEVVRAGLQSIPKGQYDACPCARPGLLAVAAPHHPAAGAQGDDPEHRQQLHRAVQGHDARVLRRHLRFSQDHRGGAGGPEMVDPGDERDRIHLRGGRLFRVLLCDVALCGADREAARGE